MKAAAEHNRPRELLTLLIVTAATLASIGSWLIGAGGRNANRVDDAMARLHRAQARLEATLAR